jgi:hypothetical protein
MAATTRLGVSAYSSSEIRQVMSYEVSPADTSSDFAVFETLPVALDVA